MTKKISFFTIIGLSIGFIIFEIKFIMTEKYTTGFIDFAGKVNIILIPILLIILMIVLGLKTFKRKPFFIIVILIFSLFLIVPSFITRQRLNTKNLTLYRQDLGLQAFYLYLDKKNNHYILVYTYPFGKKTIIGQYTTKDSKIYFDKDIKTNLELNGDQFETKEIKSIDLNKMEKLK